MVPLNIRGEHGDRSQGSGSDVKKLLSLGKRVDDYVHCSLRFINLYQRVINVNQCTSKCTVNQCLLSKTRLSLLTGSIVLSNIDKHLSNPDKPKMFTVE